MTLEVEKSPFDVKAKCHGRWNFADLEMDYPDFTRKVRQPSEAGDEEPLPIGTEDEDSIVVEGTGHAVPGLSQRNQKHHKFAQLKTECSNSIELLQGLQEFSAMDSELYSPTPKSLRNINADCNTSQTSLTSTPKHSYSSAPKHLSGNRVSHVNAAVSIFPKTSTSLQPPEDTDFDQQEIPCSKSFLAARTSAPWYLPSSSDSEEKSLLRTRQLISVDNGSLVGHGMKMSSFQADYWACAIPDSLPPSPDRQSPHWNPNKEYEDLLDYTYPLRPKYKFAKTSKCAVHNSFAHDSGVDLDSLSISPESTLKSTSMQGQEHSTAGIQSAQRFSAPLLKKPECSVPISLCRLSPVGKVSFADGSGSTGLMHSLSPRDIGSGLSDSTYIGEGGWNTRGHDPLTKSSTPNSFIRSTRVLPLQQGCSSDEEYLSLPPRLKELETLAQQLTDLSLAIRKPGYGHVQDKFPSISVNREQFLPEMPGDCSGNESLWEMYCDSTLARSSQDHGVEDLLRNQGCRDNGSTQKEIASTDTLETQCLEFLKTESHHVIQEKDHSRDSLAQCIKIFCCQLEELICWLHKVAEVTDNWIPPKPDIENVKASLQNYLEFKKDLAGHQALTGSVLQNGERLLKCMASNSPILQNTLGLITKQTEELESHAERFYESVLAAMDSLGTNLKNSDARTGVKVDSSKWVTPVGMEFVPHSLEEKNGPLA
ncbi:hypothetical protein lerEdw1_018550 [Lerista edwardsae]|nr:hypothetical protein lerEdw1_018550 [Lerista edwardsae]